MKILFISQKRFDAIGLVDKSIKKELKKKLHPFCFLELYPKGNKKFSILINYIKNIYLIITKTIIYKKIYFSWENPYVIIVKLFFPRIDIYMCVHHVENYRGKSFIGKLIIKSVKKFIAISEFTKKQINNIGVENKDIYVNYNGISGEYYPERIKNYKCFPYILYVGTEVPRKNTDTLLEVFSIIHHKYPKIKLVKIGKPGTKKAKKNFDKKIKDLNLQNSVMIKRNFVIEKELRKRYSNAICYISLSTLEGFGLTIPEAMACGCPIIASNIGPFKEICGKKEKLVNPFDKKKIEYFIEQKILNKKEKTILGENKFNWNKNTNNLILFFKEQGGV